MLKIESSHWRLWSEAETGAQWLAAQVKQGDQWVDVVPDCRAPSSANASARPGQNEASALSAANFHMIPYSNRIRDARFEFRGKSYPLENSESHAIHGALRKLAWRVTHSDNESVVFEIDTSDHLNVNWPWPMHAKIEQRVHKDVLSSTISMTNLGEHDMPAGTGWHPYFVRQIQGSMPTLTLPVTDVFPDANGDCLPDGKAVALPDALDFRTPKTLDPNQRIDCCLAGLQGSCHINWQEAGIELIMTADQSCRFLVLYNPDMPHFAVEPVTNANDAFNLDSQHIDAGTMVIAPNETLSVAMSIRAVVS